MSQQPLKKIKTDSFDEIQTINRIACVPRTILFSKALTVRILHKTISLIPTLDMGIRDSIYSTRCLGPERSKAS